MNRDKKILATSILAVLLVLLFFGVAQNLSKTHPQEIEKFKTNEPAPEVIDLQQSKSLMNQNSKLSFQALVQRDKSEKSIGLKRMPLQVIGGEAHLKVILSLKPSCNPGDADAIIQELGAVTDHKLLATFEDLSGQQKSISWDIPENFIRSGKAENIFKVPIKPEPSQYGFFLCTAQKNDTTCREKEVTDVNLIFTEHLTQTSRADEVLRTIFFQYFLVDERGLAAFSKVSQFNDPFDKLKKYLDDIKASGKVARTEVDLTQQNMQTLDSLPSVFSKGTLILELPKFQEAACR